MARKQAESSKDKNRGKQLIDIGEHRRLWVQRVSELSSLSITEVFRMMIDQFSVEDPESFAVKMEKYKLKAKLKDIERRETEIQNEKEALTKELEKEQRDGLRHVEPRVGDGHSAVRG